jgi:hypothetical protein
MARAQIWLAWGGFLLAVLIVVIDCTPAFAGPCPTYKCGVNTYGEDP